MSEWLTIEQIADYLQMSKDFIYKELQKRKIPAYKVGQRWRLSKEEIDEWVRGVDQREKIKDIKTDLFFISYYYNIQKKIEALSNIYYRILEEIGKNGKEILLTDEWLTIEQVAEYLQLSTSAIYKKIKAKQIPAYKIGKEWRFSKGEIYRWTKSGGEQ